MFMIQQCSEQSSICLSSTMARMMQLAVASVVTLVFFSSSAEAFVLPCTTVRESATRCAAKAVPASQPAAIPAAADVAPASSRVDFLRTGCGAVASALAGAALLPQESHAEVFADDVLGFKFETPDGWERGDAQISGRRKIIVYTSPKNPGANAFVVYTPVRGDFTSLGSFGTLDEVSKTVLPEAEGVKSQMVDSYTVKTSYVYDYVVNQDGRPEKHIKTIWVLFPDQGQLATVTAQCNEEDYASLGKAIDKVIASVVKT